jgi:hypothetical protein
MIRWLRLLVIVNVTGMLLQAAFAGRMLGGDDQAANLHELTAQILVILGGAIVLLVAILRFRRLCPSWLLYANIGVLVAEVLEFAMGHLHHVAIHVPLGLAIFGGAIRQLFWVFNQRRPETEKVSA